MSLRSQLKRFRQEKRSPEKLSEIKKGLAEESGLDIYYLALTVGSCAIATFGLLSNSAAVIIGAMIVAPLMLPIRCLAFSALSGDRCLFRRSIKVIALEAVLSVVLAAVLGLFIHLPSFGSEVFSRSQPTLIDLGIAITAGSISGLSRIEPKISSSLAGTAIAVALMPPLCVVGLGLSQANWTLSTGAGLLYLTNLLGITLSCMFVFSISGCTSFSQGKKALLRTLVFTSLLVFPLGIGYAQLWKQEHLEVLVREVLVNRTMTFQQLSLLEIDTNWHHNPPEAVLNIAVIGEQKPTPKQIRLLEEFVEKETGQRFSLILQIS
ncbi:MAG: TIGR00341 family protein [Cyanobacteria bacterium P01_D01_bin.1]